MIRLALSLSAFGTLSTLALAQAPYIHRVDALDALTPANDVSDRSALSADGEHVVFVSSATNLVPESPSSQTNHDLYWRDLRSGVIKRVNLDSQGISKQLSVPAFQSFPAPSISADGRYVVYASSSFDLGLGDGEAFGDVYLRDLELDVTELVSMNDPDAADVHYAYPSISGDGRWVTYRASTATLPGAAAPYDSIVLHDRLTGSTQTLATFPVEFSSSIEAGPVMSADGTTLAFVAELEPNFSMVMTYDVTTQTLLQHKVTATQAGLLDELSIDESGARIAFRSPVAFTVDDANTALDAFVLDTQAGTLQRASACYLSGDKGTLGATSLSGNGRYVAFASQGTCYAGVPAVGLHVYVADLVTGLITMQTISDLGAIGQTEFGVKVAELGGPQALSRDGEMIAFVSNYKNLATPVQGAAQLNFNIGIYVRDRQVNGPELTLSDLVAGQSATLEIAKTTPGGVLFVGYSLAGQGPFPSYWGLVDLAPPIATFTVVADADGQVSVPLDVPPAFAGTRVWMKGLDIGLSKPTTSFTGVVQSSSLVL
jgi:Tol biopolymer transport system component